MDDQPSLTRRSVLATGLTAATSGCIGPLSNGPTCTLSWDGEIESDALYRISVSHTSNNVPEGGSCSRWTKTRCFEAQFWIDTDVIDRIEARTGNDEVVAAWESGQQSTPGTTTGTETDRTSDTEDSVFRGVTETAGTEDSDFGPQVPEGALSVYLELGTLGGGENATRELVVFSDGTELDRSEYSLEC